MGATRLPSVKGEEEDVETAVNELPPTFNEDLQQTILDASALARPPMNQEQFDAKFAYKEEKTDDETKRRVKKFFKKYYYPFTSCAAFKYTILCFIPILDWLPSYSISWLPYDIMGGLTVGVMHVPQGIAYAVLAKVPAVSGLYTSFLPPLIYTVFGTSRHNSIGSFAVVSLMCGMAVTRLTGGDDITINNSTDIDPTKPTAEQVASSLTLLVGLIHFLMAILRLDFMTTYFSDQVVAGFTTGASFHVFVSQLKDFFGLTNLPRRDGPGYLIMNIYDICASIPRTNLWALLVGVCSAAFLIIGKDLVSPFISKRLKCKIPIPFELALIVISTVLSYFLKFHDNLGMKQVGVISTSPPIPAVPRFDLMGRLIPDALAISVVVVAVHISLAKMFAKKCNYEMDANQEFLALAATGTVSSFFPIYPVACSLGRTLLNFDVGTKTLLSNIFSSIFLLSIILYVGRWFETLPMPVLSAIVMVALKGMFTKFADLLLLWPVSKIDFSIWVISFLSTVFIDVTPGLAISIVYALFTTVAREQWPRWHLLGNVHGTLDFKDSERYDDVFFFHGICIFRFDSPLLFTNTDRFKKDVTKAFSSWERSHEYYVFRVERTQILQHREGQQTTRDTPPQQEYMEEGEALSRHFVIDCSGITFVDYMGVSALKEIYVEMHNRGVLLYFAAAKAPVRELFNSCGFYDTVPKDNFYPTIRDAVAIARMRQKARGQQDVQYTQYTLEHDRLSEIMSAQPMY